MFPWTRFWLPRDSDAALEQGVFLADLGGQYEGILNPDARQLAAYDDPVAVLLGEPGVGKTRSIADHVAARAGAVAVRLPDATSAGELRAEVDAALATDPGDVELVFDGLDEAMIATGAAPKWITGALRQRPAADLARLRVRVSCRPAVWPEELAASLAALWPGTTPVVLTLAPLRSTDVRSAAAALGLDGNAFLDRLSRDGALAFAARPVTLVPLLRDFADGQLPTNKTDIYRSLTRRLATELNPAVFDALLSAPPPGPTAINVAGRIAAVSTFTGQPVLWRGPDPLDRRPHELDIDECRRDDVDPPAVQRALNTALFETAGPRRFRFAHRTYGEFLAADHAVTAGLSDADLLALVTDPDGRVRPQLLEVAGWMAALRPALFDALVATDPEVLLDSDVATRNDDDRQRLAAALLLRQDLQPAPRLPAASLRRLASPNVRALVTEYLTGAGHDPRARLAALELVAASPGGSTAVADAVLDPAAGPELRAAAARRLQQGLDAPLLARLVTVLAEPALDDELRGTLLGHLWPDDLAVDDVLKAASAPPAGDGSRQLLSAYTHFLTRTLPARVSDDDLPRALSWAVGLATGSGAHASAADVLLARALGQVTGANATEVAAAYLARAREHGPYRREVDAALPALAQDRVARRALVAAVVAQPDPAKAHIRLAWRICPPDDLGWALANAAAPGRGEQERARWIDVAQALFRPFDHPDQLDTVWQHEHDTAVAAAFPDILHGTPTTGPDADRAKALLADERQWAAEAANRALLDAADPDAIEAALANDDDTAWLDLNAALEPQGPAFDPDISQSEAWQTLTTDQRDAAAGLARRWLLAAKPPEPTENGAWPLLETVAGMRALSLSSDEPATLDELTDAQWAGWARLLMGMAADYHDDTSKRAGLLTAAHDRHPDAVRAALAAELDSDARRALDALAADPVDPKRPVDPLRPSQPLSVLRAVEHVWDDGMSDVLLEWQRQRPDDIGLDDTVPFLAARGRGDAVALAETAFDDAGTDPAAARRRVAAAVALLRCPDGAVHWPRVWERWQTDEHFALAVLARLDRGAGWRLPGELEGIGEDALAALYLWLHPRRAAPANGPVDPAASVADAVLEQLVVAATPAALAAVTAVAGALPNDPAVAYRLADAQLNYRAASWQPPEPEQLRALLDDPARRLVTTDPALADVVVESLRRAQARISGETPAVGDLWDHPRAVDKREPKPENDLSDWLKRHLANDLAGVVVNREVQITAGFTGVRKRREVDLHVTALAPGNDPAAPPRRLSVIVEDKGCWNAKVDTDMETQLAGTYLPQTGAGAGVYVVFRFDCKASGSKRSCSACRHRTHDELDDDMQQQAGRLTGPGRVVRAVVLDARLAPP